jgi:2-polyprenyl-3-methyl-5-hydroxy-6-metoxy-1,4-benzoquinol methylase
MIRFAMDESHKWRELRVLDYGGGGGQFAFVFKSHFPQSTVYITDINDNRLLDEWGCCNRQIPFEQFPSDRNTYDFIFMCDVFEHISDPTSTLLQLICKLNDNGKIFIDTPKYFWLYPVLQRTSKYLYSRLLKGTVSMAHLQLWSKESFYMVVKEAGLAVTKYSETSEFTMPADFYLHNMGINNKLLRIIGRLFYKSSKVLVRNKIMSVLSKPV